MLLMASKVYTCALPLTSDSSDLHLCQGVLIVAQLFCSEKTGPDSSVGRVSAPGNGRSRVRSRAATYQSR